MKFIQKFLKIIFYTLPLFIALIFFANKQIIDETKLLQTSNIENIRYCKTALLLGTSKYLKNGHKNDYFFKRIMAATKLYKSNKFKYIIISGDNSLENYNEPLDMKNELILNGIPDSVIYLDYAGFRTFDSVIRANEIFGQDSLLIVSQKFHNERAIFIARKNKIFAFGFNAEDVSVYNGFKTSLREYLARTKVFIDIFFNAKPKFLGDKITIP